MIYLSIQLRLVFFYNFGRVTIAGKTAAFTSVIQVELLGFATIGH